MSSNGRAAASRAGAEANVVLELQMVEPISEEALGANAEEVIEAILECPDIALGPALATNCEEQTIELRFDVRASNEEEVDRSVAQLLGAIAAATTLRPHLCRSRIEAWRTSPRAEFASA